MAGLSGERQFEKVVRETQSRIRAYIAGMGVALDEVDDVAQEVYIAFYQTGDNIPKASESIQWLKGIAKNLCLNHFRKEKRNKEHHETVANMLIQTRSSWEEIAVSNDHERALNDCLRKLAKRSKMLVALHYGERLTSEAIAQTTKTSSEAVRIALFRIRHFLRDCITSQLSPGAEND